MGRYLSSITLAGAGLLISLLLVAKGPRWGDKGAAPLRAAATDLDMKQRELAAAVEARATTLAQLPRLSWAVATDEATVRDLTPDELGFRVQAGELIEVVQLQRKTSQVVPLLRIPASSPALHAPMNAPGPCLLVSGDQLLVASVASVEPREGKDVLGGALVVARRLDVSAITRQLLKAGITARLATSSGSVTLTDLPALARQPEVTLPVGSLRLIGRLPAPHTGAWILIGLLVLVIWSGAAVVAARRAGASAGLDPIGAPALAPARPSEPIYDDLRDTTPVLDLLVAERNITASSSNGVHGHRHNGLHGPMVEIVTGPVTAGVPHTDAIPASTGDFMALFREFIDLRKRCGDKSNAPTFDQFVHLLDQRRTEMLQAHAASEVLFQIVFIDGRAVVRAKGVN